MGTNSTSRVANVIERFVLEPRAEWVSGRKWLVALDQRTGEYVRAVDEPSTRAYKRFNDSREAIEWLIKNYDAINTLAK